MCFSLYQSSKQLIRSASGGKNSILVARNYSDRDLFALVQYDLSFPVGSRDVSSNISSEVLHFLLFCRFVFCNQRYKHEDNIPWFYSWCEHSRVSNLALSMKGIVILIASSLGIQNIAILVQMIMVARDITCFVSW
jgi:hypothetical protein